MIEAPLAPYLHWAKTRHPAAIDLAGSNLLHCSLDDLPGARETLDLVPPFDEGYAPLVEAIAAHYRTTTDRIVTAPGCSGANFDVIAALVAAGDDVLVERPTYDPLLGACRLLGANIRRFDRRFEAGYIWDLDDVRSCLTPRTRLIIVTRPHNPSGVVVDDAAVLALGRLADRVGTHVLVDEVYLDAANLIREDLYSEAPAIPHVLPAALLDGPFISTSSLTKSYGLAGLRCGWAVASARIADCIRHARDVIDSVSSSPAELLSAFAFSRLPALRDRTRRLVGANIERARGFLAAHTQLQVACPPATTVMFPRLAGVETAEPFVQRLLEHSGVAVVPGRYFESPAHFRVSLAGRTDMLEEGLKRIGEALDKLAASSRPD